MVRGETTWVWNFGDGATATTRNPGPHTYKLPGTYTVKLTMTTPVGKDAVQHSYTVKAPPPPTDPPPPPSDAPTGPPASAAAPS